MKRPSVPETVLRAAPVLTFRITSFTSGTAAPAGSRTVPCKVPVADWPKTQLHRKGMAQRNRAMRLATISNLRGSRYHPDPQDAAPTRTGHPPDTVDERKGRAGS